MIINTFKRPNVMMNFNDVPVASDEGFMYVINTILSQAKEHSTSEASNFEDQKSSHTLLVISNNISNVVSKVLDTVKDRNDYSVYRQKSPLTAMPGILTPEYQKQEFTDFCNYFDKHNGTSVLKFVKRLNNLRNNSQIEVYADYPSDIKMILILEDFNLWDLNSQYYFTKLSRNPNIIVVGQIRTDLDFAVNHLDREAWTMAMHIHIEE